MQLILKILLSLAVITAATAVSRRTPSLGGLIATMPLTGLLVTAWVYIDSGGDRAAMTGFARGALFGVLPSLGFFLVAWLCFRSGLGLAASLVLGMAAWLLGAALHRVLLG